MNNKDKIPKWFIIFLVAMFAVLFYIVEDSFGYGIVDRTATRDTLSIPFQYLDTLGESVDAAANDSFYIMVFSPGGTEVFRDSMVYDDGSITESAWEDFAGGNHYTYNERVSILDGSSTADGVFSYHIVAWDNSLSLQTHYYGQFQIVNSTLEGSLDSAAFAEKAVDSLADVLDSLETISVWLQDSLYAIIDSLQNQDDWVAQNAYFDTLIYIGEHGLGIFIDSTVGNTNTVIGVDGTEKNPVSTLAAGRTLALALGAHRFYIHGGSTFNGAGTDLAADYSGWEFYGEGHGIELAFGGQLVTNSYFHNMTLSGAMHASGEDVLFQDCDLGYISANFNGTADNCLLLDTLVLKANRDIVIINSQSGVAGAHTPTLDFSGGSSLLDIRHYSGGLRFMNASSNDTVSMEADGQAIISANSTSLAITLRGMMTVTDSGTTTKMTKDAVFSRQEADLWVWANTDTLAVDSSLMGEWLSTGINASISEANMAKIADSVWFADFEAHDGVAGTFGDSAQGWGATSASALDSQVVSNLLWRIVFGLPKGSGSDSTTLAQRLATTWDATADATLKSLTVNNSAGIAVQFLSTGSNGHGMYVLGNGAGDGVRIIAGATGNGMWVDGGATSGHGIYATGEGGGDGISAVGGNTGSGMYLTTTATNGHGLELEGTGTGSDLYQVTDGGGLTTDTLNAILDSLQLQDDWIPTATNIMDTLFDGMLVSDTTSGKYMSKLMRDVSNASSTAVVIKDTVYGIIDSLQNQDDWVATEVTAAKALDSLADILDSLETMSTWIQDSLYAVIDSLQIKFANRTAFDWANNTVATVTAVSNEVTADVTKISGDATAADNFETMLDGTGGQQLTLGRFAISGANSTNYSFSVINSTGTAVGFTSTGSNGVGFFTGGQGTGSGFQAQGGVTNAGGITAISTGTGKDIELLNDGLIAVMPDDWTAADSTAYQGAASGLSATKVADTVWGIAFDVTPVGGSYGDSATGWGAFGAGGSGDYTYTLKVVDTLGTDSLRSNVKVTMKNTVTDEVIGPLWSDANGICVFSLDSQSYTIEARDNGYIYDLKIDTVASNQTDTVEGRNVVYTSAAGSKVCNVTVQVLDHAGAAIAGVTVRAALARSRVTDSAGSVIINRPTEDKTNSSGQVTFTCIWSTYLIPETQWEFTVKSPAGAMKKRITVPRQASLLLDMTQ